MQNSQLHRFPIFGEIENPTDTYPSSQSKRLATSEDPLYDQYNQNRTTFDTQYFSPPKASKEYILLIFILPLINIGQDTYRNSYR